MTTRDKAWVLREYGAEKWPAVEATVSSVADLGRIAAVRDAVVRNESLADDPDAPYPCVVGGALVEAPRAVTLWGFLGWVAQSVAARTVGVDAVIEPGSGWGRQLFGVWGSGRAPDALYVAAELTESGRRASEAIARLDRSLRFEAMAFDYMAPELSLPALSSAVVFTVHSVEQVPQLPAAFIDFVSAIAPRVTCLHFEPVGWQLDPGSSGSSASYAQQHDYNRNLVPLLRGAADEGRIRLLTTQVDVIGLNPANATSLIAWEPVR